MKDPLSRVLLGCGDSNWYWRPLVGMRPKPEQRMSVGPVLMHAVSGFLATALPAGLGARMWLGRWSADAFLVPGALGFLAGMMGCLLVSLAWNRRAAECQRAMASGQSIPPATARTTTERFLLGPAVGLMVLAMAGSLVTLEENLRGDLALRAFEVGLRSKGAPLSVSDIVPPPVPDERNLALAPMFKPALDYKYEPSDASRSLPSDSHLVWLDTNGLARIREVMRIEDDKVPFASFDAGRRKARSKATGLKSEDPGRTENWTQGVRVDLGLWQAYYRSLTNWPKSEVEQTPGKDVLLALGRRDADLAELRAAMAERPECRFPLRYSDGFSMLLPQLSHLKRMSLMLRLRSVALLAEGRTDEALQDALLGFRLGDAIADEPILISSLVRVAIDALMLQPVWEGCQDHRWNEAQLVALQGSLRRRDYLAEIRRSLDGERVLSGMVYDSLCTREGRDWVRLFGDTNERGASEDQLQLFLWLAPRGWVRQNQVAHWRYLRALTEDLAAARCQADIQDWDSRLGEFIGRNSFFGVIAGTMAPAVGRASEKSYVAEANRRLALVALALERHRLAVGAYPASLDALVPRFLESVPSDPMNGAALKYATALDIGFHLYSVGLDHVDDGGVRAWGNARRMSRPREGGDLVWQ